MLLPCWQPAYRADNFFSRQSSGAFDGHSFQHFRQRRTTRKCGRTAIGEKSRGFNATVTKAQSETQTIAADGIGFLSGRISIREFPSVTRMRDVIFKGFRIRQG